MITALDCHYRSDHVVAAACAVNCIEDAMPSRKLSVSCPLAGDYQPGQFYLRELPALLELISKIDWESSIIVVDGYVDLGLGHDGLGMHLFRSLNDKIPVIGVAKNQFLGNTSAVSIRRGISLKPLYVTSIGLDVSVAGEMVRKMSGEFRLPTLLKSVDQLSKII